MSGFPEQVGNMPYLMLAISVVENQNFGDHGERITVAHDYLPGESVDDLARRVFRKLGRPYTQHDYGDVIEIRVVVGTDEVKPQEVDTVKEAF